MRLTRLLIDAMDILDNVEGFCMVSSTVTIFTSLAEG